MALEGVVKSFSAAHADAAIVNFPFASIQRGFVTNYGQLGFVNAISGCASDLAITQYSTGNLYNLADPTFTADGAKVSNDQLHFPHQNAGITKQGCKHRSCSEAAIVVLRKAVKTQLRRLAILYCDAFSPFLSVVGGSVMQHALETACIPAGHLVSVSISNSEAQKVGQRFVWD